MTRMAKPGTEWSTTYSRCTAVAPEAFHGDRLLNYWGGHWRRDGAALVVRRVPGRLPAAIRQVTFGNPLAVESADDPLPDLDFGPLINDAKVKELGGIVDDTIARGGVPLYRGSLADGLFVPGQNTDVYLAPVAMLALPPSSPLHHAEPFGPVDTIVLIDTEAELLAAMNASNGALVASLACDDEQAAGRLAADIQAFKVGVNRLRSRGDRAEVFGGKGASWRGAFVGGHLLVHATTQGPAGERLHGNFPSYSLYPPT